MLPVLYGVTPEMRAYHDESFGPLASIVIAANADEALRVETVSAAGLAAKTIINIVAVVKLVVASAVNEEGDQICPRTWNYEFIQTAIGRQRKAESSYHHSGGDFGGPSQ